MMNLAALDDEALLKMRAEVEKEASKRGLLTSVGEIGEKLAIALFRRRPDLPVLTLAPAGTKNVDAISRDGERYSIKTLLRATKTGTIYPDPADLNKQLFEHLIIVLLMPDFQLQRVVVLSWNEFCAVRGWDKRMSAWYVGRTQRALGAGRQIFPKGPI